MAEVRLVVNGKRYEGWKSVRVTRSIESLEGTFALEASDRWDGRVDPWTIREEDACRVEIDDTVVIDGYIDKRSISASKEARTLSYSGRDRAGTLADCSAIVEAGSASKSKWTFYDVDVFEVATKIAAPFGIPVALQPGLRPSLAREKKVVVQPGDKCYDVISRLATNAGVLVVSDGAGGIVITRAGKDRAAPLIEGQNILSASVEYNGADRYHRYVISSQIPSTDAVSGDATRVQAQAIDEGVRRTERVLLIRPDKGYNLADSRRRADWEARLRAARAEQVTVTVLGWKQPDGTLWPVNKLARVHAPRLIGVDGDMTISQVEYSTGSSGKVTQIRLVRPDAFAPEPKATVRSRPAGWVELRRGGAQLSPGDFDPDLARHNLGLIVRKLKKEP